MHSASVRVPSTGQTLSDLGFTSYNLYDQPAETNVWACQFGNMNTFLPKMKESMICQYQTYRDNGKSKRVIKRDRMFE